jgi:transposase-like protein
MMVQSACQGPLSRTLATAKLSRPNCPQCGSVLLVAEESWFSASGRIEHAWSCDDCSYEFLTSIRLWRR